MWLNCVFTLVICRKTHTDTHTQQLNDFKCKQTINYDKATKVKTILYLEMKPFFATFFVKAINFFTILGNVTCALAELNECDETANTK